MRYLKKPWMPWRPPPFCTVRKSYLVPFQRTAISLFQNIFSELVLIFYLTHGMNADWPSRSRITTVTAGNVLNRQTTVEQLKQLFFVLHSQIDQNHLSFTSVCMILKTEASEQCHTSDICTAACPNDWQCAPRHHVQLRASLPNCNQARRIFAFASGNGSEFSTAAPSSVLVDLQWFSNSLHSFQFAPHSALSLSAEMFSLSERADTCPRLRSIPVLDSSTDPTSGFLHLGQANIPRDSTCSHQSSITFETILYRVPPTWWVTRCDRMRCSYRPMFGLLQPGIRHFAIFPA